MNSEQQWDQGYQAFGTATRQVRHALERCWDELLRARAMKSQHHLELLRRGLAIMSENRLGSNGGVNRFDFVTSQKLECLDQFSYKCHLQYEELCENLMQACPRERRDMEILPLYEKLRHRLMQAHTMKVHCDMEIMSTVHAIMSENICERDGVVGLIDRFDSVTVHKLKCLEAVSRLEDIYYRNLIEGFMSTCAMWRRLSFDSTEPETVGSSENRLNADTHDGIP